MPAAPLRFVFMGSDALALPLLDWLHAEQTAGRVQLLGVFTQPDRPVGRGQKVVANAIKSWALTHALPVLQPERLDDAAYAELTALQPDVVLVMAYGHILRQRFIDVPRLGTLNLHASLLPAYRGASPIQTAIAQGEITTGVSLMRIVRQLDAGPVADTEPVPIGPHDTALEVEARLGAACVPLLARTLGPLAAGALTFVEQRHVEATFCRKLEKEDGALDFAAPAALLAARINGLFPWPGCVVPYAGQVLKIGLADVACDSPETAPAEMAAGASRSTSGLDAAAVTAARGEPGCVLGADEAGLRVATGEGVLRLLRLQRPGGRMLPAREFLRGLPIPTGTVLASSPMITLLASAPMSKPVAINNMG